MAKTSEPASLNAKTKPPKVARKLTLSRERLVKLTADSAGPRPTLLITGCGPVHTC